MLAFSFPRFFKANPRKPVCLIVSFFIVFYGLVKVWQKPSFCFRSLFLMFVWAKQKQLVFFGMQKNMSWEMFFGDFEGLPNLFAVDVF